MNKHETSFYYIINGVEWEWNCWKFVKRNSDAKNCFVKKISNPKNSFWKMNSVFKNVFSLMFKYSFWYKSIHFYVSKFSFLCCLCFTIEQIEIIFIIYFIWWNDERILMKWNRLNFLITLLMFVQFKISSFKWSS